jgi:hypothetical protein
MTYIYAYLRLYEQFYVRQCKKCSRIVKVRF